MTWKRGVETLWRFVGQQGAVRVGGASLGRQHISAAAMTLKMGVETLWCYAGQQLAASEGVCGGGGKPARGVGFAALLWVFLRQGAYLSSLDDIEDGRGDALAVCWSTFC